MKVFFPTTALTIDRFFIELLHNCFGSQTSFSKTPLKISEVDIARLNIPCNWIVCPRNKHKLSLYGWCLESEIKQLTWLFLRSVSGITESGHPTNTFFSSAAKRVTLVINLNCHFCHFVFYLFCVQTSMISCLLTYFYILVKSDLVKSSIDSPLSVFFSKHRKNNIRQFLYWLTQISRQCWFLLHNQVFQRLDPVFH